MSHPNRPKRPPGAPRSTGGKPKRNNRFSGKPAIEEEGRGDDFRASSRPNLSGSEKNTSPSGGKAHGEATASKDRSQRPKSGGGGKPPGAGHRKGPQRGAGKAKSAGAWLYGRHAVLAALDNPLRHPQRLLATREAIDALRPFAESRDISIEQTDRAALDRLLPEDAVHQGMALLADPLPDQDVDDIADEVARRESEAVGIGGVGPNMVAVMLDGVTDPRNIGAILRSAAAFGAVAVVVQDRRAPEESGLLAKSACGALETVPVVRVANLSRALEEFSRHGFWCIGLDGEAETTLAAAKPQGRLVLVMGSEGSGLRRLVREHCDQLARIPMPGMMESLNVSAAASVCLYEILGR